MLGSYKITSKLDLDSNPATALKALSKDFRDVNILIKSFGAVSSGFDQSICCPGAPINRSSHNHFFVFFRKFVLLGFEVVDAVWGYFIREPSILVQLDQR